MKPLLKDLTQKWIDDTMSRNDAMYLGEVTEVKDYTDLHLERNPTDEFLEWANSLDVKLCQECQTDKDVELTFSGEWLCPVCGEKENFL